MSTTAWDFKSIAQALLPEGLRLWLARLFERIGEVAALGATIMALLVRMFR